MAQRKKHASVRARRNKAATQATLRRVEDAETNLEAYMAMTVAQLREAVDIANANRPADQQLSKRGTKAVLVEALVAAERQIPDMPPHPPRYDDDGYEISSSDWHPQTEAWWNDVWTSPMAQEWDHSDIHNLFALALLYDDIWTAGSPRQRKEALSEYRLQRGDLGLSPYSRRRLEWTVETAEEAKARGEKRRGNGRSPAAAAKATREQAAKPDPRAHLAAVP